MQSRTEDILQAMIDGTDSSELAPPQSRVEVLLQRILDKMNAGGGGGGGLPIHICTQDEYDAMTRVPTVQNPDEETLYLVPSAGSSSGNLFNEWIYVDNSWEMLGSITNGIAEAVEDWLDNHPEATTTVQDGAITYAKLNSDLQGTVDDVGELKTAIDDLVTEVKPKNYYDGTYWPVDGFITAGAVFTPSSGYKTTNPIYLPAGDYLFDGYTTSLGANAVNCFSCDSEGGSLALIGGTNVGTAYDNNAIIHVNLANDGYYRFNVVGIQYLRNFMLVAGSTASDFPAQYYPYSESYTEINKEIKVESGSEMLTKVLKAPTNLFSGEYYSTNGYISGASVRQSDSYRITEPTLLEPGSYVLGLDYGNLGGNCSNAVKCDADGENREAIAATALNVTRTINGMIYNLHVIDIHIKGYYMFNCGAASKAAYMMIVSGVSATDYPEAYVPYATPYYMVMPGVYLNDEMLAQRAYADLKGKMLSVNGDSICSGAGSSGGYAKIISEITGMGCQNIGQGGGTITAESYSGETPRHWISRTISNMDENADYALLEGGVNDASLGLPLGSISSGYTATLDDTTFYGAMESCLKQLTTRFAGKKIGFIIVHQMTTNYRNINEENTSYYWAVVKCCEKWGVPYLDLNKQVPAFGYFPQSSETETALVNMRNTYTYNGDGWHPTEAGYKKYYVPKIIAWMQTL